MKKLLISLVAAVFVLACCEGAARIAYWLVFHEPYRAATIEARVAAVLERQTAKRAAERGAAGRAHPYYGFVARDDRPLPARRDFGRMTASQLGFTGDTPLFDPTGKTFLVVVLGGSVAHYFALDKGRELVAWLEKRPEFAGRSGRLLDAALPGYKEPQQLLILADLLALGARPDVVINLDGFNEACIAAKNLDAGGYPFMPWFWGGDDVPSRQRLRLLGRMELLETLRDAAARLLSRAPALPALLGFPAAALDRLADARVATIDRELAREKASADPLARQRVSPDGGFYLGPNVVVTRDAFPGLAAGEWARASILLHDMTRDAGGRYFHALQPVEPLWAAARGEAPGPLCPEPCAEAVSPTLARYGAALATAGVRFADLGPAMTATAGAFKDCCHVTPAGQDALFAGMTGFLDRAWNAPAPAVNPEKALAGLTGRPAPPFAGADLLATPAPGNVVAENLRAVERSAQGPYRTALGREVAVSLSLDAPGPLTVAFGLKNPLPGQSVAVSLNGRDLGTFPLVRPEARLEKTLEAQGAAGLNTLTFVFGRANTGPGRNMDIPEGYAAQFTALSLRPAGADAAKEAKP